MKNGRPLQRGKRGLLVSLAALAGLLVLVLFWVLRGQTGTVPQELDFLQPAHPASLRWVFVTRYGEEFPEQLPGLLPTEETLESLAGMPVDPLFCTVDKYLNYYAAGEQVDVVTACYADAKLRRFETSGAFLPLQTLVEYNVPGFEIPSWVERWCGNLKGDLYAYPHTSTIARTEDFPSPGVVVLAHKALLERYQALQGDTMTQGELVEALKLIRKKEPGIYPAYLDLPTLQQFFGATIEDEKGAWREPFCQEETLEALKFMNLLYRERLLPQQVFSLTPGTLMEDLGQGKVFLAATSLTGLLATTLPPDHPIWDTYQVIGPLVPDTGKPLALRGNYTEEYASTLFVKNSHYPRVQARLFARFYQQNNQVTPKQQEALEKVHLLEEMHAVPVPSWASLYAPYAVPTMPYEILFSYYADTKLADLDDRMESYRNTQVIRMVINLPPSEVEPAYALAKAQLLGGEYDLLWSWKRERYRKAKVILAEEKEAY